MNARIFQRSDWICGAIAALIAFAVYAWTAAPSVTLLDSGEFLVAAQHFGVPHPTGYPLWTFLAWLFHLLPLGNVAWQLALFSGICGALAVGLAAMLIRSSALWMLPNSDAAFRTASGICAISLSLVFAFSFSMWSQAVIVEVYTLQALLVALYLTSLYAWLRRPEKMAGLYWSFFTFSLAFSNHQLALALAPLPFLIVLLVRRDLFWDLLIAVLVCALIAYLAFALFSNETLVVKAAIRLGYLILTILAITLLIQRGRVQWRLIAFLPFVLALGLLPYIYLPVASATNPPMNWNYTRTPDGFFASFNRSQYPGSLSEKSLRVLSKVLGVAPEEKANETKAQQSSTIRELREWCGFFWTQIARSFSPAAFVFFLAALVGAFRKPVAARAWIYLLILAFVLAMALQPVLEHARTDKASWWMQMPYHTYTNLLFGIVCGVGACLMWNGIVSRIPKARHAIWALLLLPLWPVFFNANEASQRGHWFGWKYGHDMLAGLPKGSVLFGGTDPGRFVPTYLILGESTLPPNRRIDSSFDRSDLYILTQNGLSDRYYLAYIRDQYTAARPPVRTEFERWLGRETAYPAERLILPTVEEMRKIRQDAAREARASGKQLSGSEVGEAATSAVAKWIFERNKARHAFFVEEYFPMTWSYDYAIPEGLVYRIHPEPLEKLPDEAVEKDFAFWSGYVAELKSDPAFANDYDAQRSFSRLRLTGAEIYKHRGMNAEAEKAYRQAIDLWIGNLNAITGLSTILWQRNVFDEPIALLEQALRDDPNSSSIRNAWALAVQRKETQSEIESLLAQWRSHPQEIDPLRKIVILYSQAGEPEKADAILREAVPKLGSNPKFLFLVVQISEAQNNWYQSADAARRWIDLEPQSVEAHYRLARAELMLGRRAESLKALETAISLNGVAIRERLFSDRYFGSVRETPEFKRLMVAPASNTKAGAP